jgi:hypothetical protein
LTVRKNNKSQNTFNIQDFRDKPKVPLAEIKASKQVRKKHVKKHIKEEDPLPPIKDFLTVYT